MSSNIKQLLTLPFKRYSERKRLKRFENTPMIMFKNVGEPLPNAKNLGERKGYTPSKAIYKIYNKPLWRDKR